MGSQMAADRKSTRKGVEAMNLDQIEKLRDEIRMMKDAGRSKIPVHLVTLEHLIAAALECKAIPGFLKGARS